MKAERWYGAWGKRALDLTFAIVAGVVLAPVLLLVGLCSLLVLERPILFRQRRAGRDGLGFWAFKFRSMTDERGADGALLPDELRLGWYGRLLRTTSVDELPSLWNVLKGEMSLVGPRPLPVEFLAHYSKEQARRHEVRPGITGWAAVNGRNAQSYESIFAHDVWYADQLSLGMDLRILLRTVLVVLRRSGIERGDANRNSEFAARLRRAEETARAQTDRLARTPVESSSGN